MITDILNVTSSDEGRSITFNVMADPGGADEIVSVTLNEERFAIPVRLGPSEVATVSIRVAETDLSPIATERFRVVVVAEQSGTRSGPTDLTLSYKEPGPRRRKP